MRARAAVLLVLAFVSSSCYTFEYESLEKVLQEGSKREIHDFFSGVSQSSINENAIGVFSDIYRGPQGYTSKRNLDIVKINALNVLIQAKRNGWKIADDIVNDGFGIALEYAGSNNDYIARTAIRVLSIYDRPKGFDELLKLTEKEDARLYRAGVLGLVSMCNSFDREKFGRLLDGVSIDNRRIAKEIKEEFLEFASSSGWCNG